MERMPATLLVTVPGAARGLDFPNVSHVYCVGKIDGADDADRAATYAHMAGRCGRVGQAARGVVTTIGSDDVKADLKTLLDTQFDGLDLNDVDAPQSLVDAPLPDDPDGLGPPGAADMETQRAYLEDVLTFAEPAPDPET